MVDITVYGVPALSRHTRVTSDGKIDMPLLGYCPIAVMTIEDARLSWKSGSWKAIFSKIMRGKPRI